MQWTAAEWRLGLNFVDLVGESCVLLSVDLAALFWIFAEYIFLAQAGLRVGIASIKPVTT